MVSSVRRMKSGEMHFKTDAAGMFKTDAADMFKTDAADIFMIAGSMYPDPDAGDGCGGKRNREG